MRSVEGLDYFLPSGVDEKDVLGAYLIDPDDISGYFIFHTGTYGWFFSSEEGVSDYYTGFKKLQQCLEAVDDDWESMVSHEAQHDRDELKSDITKEG